MEKQERSSFSSRVGFVLAASGSACLLYTSPFTFCLSRTLSGLAIVTFPKAKKTGSVSAMARGAKDRQVKATMCVYLLILLAGMLLVDWKLGLLVYGIAILVYALYYRNAMKYFGGTTGDLAGDVYKRQGQT